MSKELSVSVVSHGHGSQVLALLTQLATVTPPVARVWLTLNVPEPELERLKEAVWPFELQMLINRSPKGFGANHNQAFASEAAHAAPASFFCVINPDLTWQQDPFPALLAVASRPGIGCVYPVQFDTHGQHQDYKRARPTLAALCKRHALGRHATVLAEPDWVNAALLVFPLAVYAELKGFDTDYFMYCEDVDLCLRLQAAGFQLSEATQARVVHDARRASRRNIRHLAWHLISLLRLWRSEAFRQHKRQGVAASNIQNKKSDK